MHLEGGIGTFVTTIEFSISSEGANSDIPSRLSYFSTCLVTRSRESIMQFATQRNAVGGD